MKVVVAPDSFGGTLTSPEAAAAIAAGWARARPRDELVLVPLADGGEGTLAVLNPLGGRWHRAEVADPLGRPREARWLELADGRAVIESAEACGLHLVGRTERDPLRTTTYGVGQLLEDARSSGAERIAVGLGGSATVDGGAGAATALGLRLRRADGSGLKIGGGELVQVDRVERGWLSDGWAGVRVELWADVRTTLADAAATFGPQKGATPAAVATLREGLRRWAAVAERDLGGGWSDLPGSGAAGGLGFGPAAVLGARLRSGAEAVAELVQLATALRDADVVVTGEGRLDPTSLDGKVVGHVLQRAGRAGTRALAVVGQLAQAPPAGLDVEAVGPGGAGGPPAAEVAEAAQRLAARAGAAGSHGT